MGSSVDEAHVDAGTATGSPSEVPPVTPFLRVSKDFVECRNDVMRGWTRCAARSRLFLIPVHSR